MSGKNVVMAVGGAAVGLLMGGLLLGRAVAQQYQQPGGYAQQQYAQPQARYQYKCITKAPDRIWTPEAVNMLNSEGAQGWRLMENRFIFPNGYSDVYCFERRY
jgi:hypothetical protein